MNGYQEFEAYVGEINDLLCVLNLLNWDANTNLPPDGASARGQQMATITKLAQEMFVSDKMGRLLVAAEKDIDGDPAQSYEARAVATTRQQYHIARSVPSSLLAELAVMRSSAEQDWKAAKATGEFGRFAPHLERYVALNRDLCAAIGYGDGHPYDAMLKRYEPGMTVAKLKQLFSQLHAGIKPLLDRIVASGIKMPIDILQRDFPIEQQKAFCYNVAQTLGYDMRRGHFHVAPHPFEISFTRQDVRITNRYQRNWLAGGIFGMIHETGHALYEQGVSANLTRTAHATDFLSQYAVGGVTFGTHESQSRLWENQIGRSLPFWQRHFPTLQSHFPDTLADVDAETFYRAVNHVEPSLIRVEADEVTYNFHIMMRFEIETGLLDGSMSVNDLPTIWRDKMRSYLGITPESDSVGVLQDIHWAFGQMGTFPAYTIGNVMSAQWFEAAHRAMPQLASHLASGNYQPLLTWLTDHVYQHGRAYTPDELLQMATGETLNATPYLNYLNTKYSNLYSL